MTNRAMNIDDLFDDSGEERDKECPECGSNDTESVEYYYRCNNSSCDVITFPDS